MSEPVTYFRGQEDLVDTDNEAEAETCFLGHNDLIDTGNEAPACSVQSEAAPVSQWADDSGAAPGRTSRGAATAP